MECGGKITDTRQGLTRHIRVGIRQTGRPAIHLNPRDAGLTSACIYRWLSIDDGYMTWSALTGSKENGGAQATQMMGSEKQILRFINALTLLQRVALAKKMCD
jgi:hypothetical protein